VPLKLIPPYEHIDTHYGDYEKDTQVRARVRARVMVRVIT